MKSMRRRVVAMLLTLSMLITMFPASMLANGTSTDGNKTWQISKSKTAAKLDDNYQSEVTLSLPAAQEQLESDVVFVLDKSTSASIQEDAIMYDISSGTNSHAGLLAAQAMLENSDTPDNRKYIVFVCDGITYMFDNEVNAINS